MPAARHFWTTAEVRALQDDSRAWPRYELLGGELIVTPAPGWPHQIAVGELLLAIEPYVSREKLGVTLVSPADLELLPGTIAQPDVFVVPARPPNSAEETLAAGDLDRILLAIEIISPSSVRTDRVEKRDHYLSAGVPEYWVVDLDARVIERWRPERETPELLPTSLEWEPAGAGATLTVDVVGLFNTIWGKFGMIGRRRIVR